MTGANVHHPAAAKAAPKALGGAGRAGGAVGGGCCDVAVAIGCPQRTGGQFSFTAGHMIHTTSTVQVQLLMFTRA